MLHRRTPPPRPRPLSIPSFITHPQRVIDPLSGVTKGELAAYYEGVAPLLLQHLRSRPVALLRAPAGVGGPFFFQKHADPGELPGVELLDRALDPAHEPHLGIASRRGVLSAAQMNVVEFHTWGATTRAIDRPDRIIFDLDPGAGVEWPALRDAARTLRALLDEIGLVTFVKTSGGKGLHVLVPLTPRQGWDAVRGFAHAVVDELARRYPERFVAKSGERNRIGRIFIDYLRNGFAATTVAAWSARARPGLGVSVPMAWDELDSIGAADHWTVRTVAQRLAIGDAPWADYRHARQGLTAAMKRIGFDPKEAA
ncbi:MAG TPA: non-homologous end-joining DNA ligase [Burkholderiaceae bacterium]